MQCRVAPRPYVRLCPLAYVMGSRPRGSIGSPPERGAEVYMVWSRHVSAPDPHLALTKAWVFFVSESRDPAEGGLDPTQRGLGPILGVRSVPTEVLDPARRSGPDMQGSGTFQRYLGGYCLPWPRNDLGAVHVVGSGTVYRATR
jgi:hypothetical protein